MPKGEYQRKLRKIDYSKKEVADRLHCAENTVDSKIKQLCKDYDLPEGFFKRDGYDGLNFFPPEYTPLLIELLKNKADNPALPRAKKHTKVMAEDVANYCNLLIESINKNEEIPDYMKQWLQEMPWMRNAKDISMLIDLFVVEIQVFICNIFNKKNVDIGQAIRKIVYMLDRCNYEMFENDARLQMLKKYNEESREKMERELYSNLKDMNLKEREEYFKEVPSALATYNKYSSCSNNDQDFALDSRDLSLDWGLLSMIRTLMQNGDANQLKKGNKMVLKEFVSNENDCIKSEREAYMEAVHDNVIESLKRDCSPGQVDFIIDSWKKWQCKAEEIKSGEIKDEFGYLKYFEQIKQDYVLKDIVSNFIGRLMVDYVFSFNKK